jgi:hypothetical protein
MTKIVKSTDLTKIEGDPGHRANVDLPLENVDFQAQASPVISRDAWSVPGVQKKTLSRSSSASSVSRT